MLLLIFSSLSLNAYANVSYFFDSFFKIDFKTKYDANLSFNSAIKKNIEALKFDAITYDEFLTINSIRAYVILDEYNDFHRWRYISN